SPRRCWRRCRYGFRPGPPVSVPPPPAGRRCSFHIRASKFWSSLFFRSVDVALIIHAHRDGLTVPHGPAAPDAIGVLLQAADLAVAARLDARPGLILGEAVG